jgi:hypothetical protein
MNYAKKHLTRQKTYKHKYSNTCRISRRIYFQIYYVGIGDSKQEREGGESSEVEKDTLGF